MVVLIMELEFGRCCGNCVHCNRPKQPQDHEAHYMVAKTERWCFNHKCYITRESVCESFELEEKKVECRLLKELGNSTRELEE